MLDMHVLDPAEEEISPLWHDEHHSTWQQRLHAPPP